MTISLLGHKAAMTILVFRSDTDEFTLWKSELERLIPQLEVRHYRTDPNPAEADIVLAWKAPHGAYAAYTGARLIHSLGAGIDHLLADPQLPAQAAICRLVDPLLTLRMIEYVTLHVLRHHRRHSQLVQQQQNQIWEQIAAPAARDRTVGVMGLGALGGAVATALHSLGFHVHGWSRSAKSFQGIDTFHGSAGLKSFLQQTEILVCLLPLTEATRDIVNQNLLSQLPRGACFINAARGHHVVDDDLLAALDNGQIAEATLDVFRAEPLPTDHPYWRHPHVTVTPHIASLTDPLSAAAVVADNIHRLLHGRPLVNQVDRTAGY